MVGMAVGRYQPNADQMEALLEQLKELKTTDAMIQWLKTKGPPQFTASSGPTDPKVRGQNRCGFGQPPPPPKAGCARGNPKGAMSSRLLQKPSTASRPTATTKPEVKTATLGGLCLAAQLNAQLGNLKKPAAKESALPMSDHEKMMEQIKSGNILKPVRKRPVLEQSTASESGFLQFSPASLSSRGRSSFRISERSDSSARLSMPILKKPGSVRGSSRGHSPAVDTASNKLEMPVLSTESQRKFLDTAERTDKDSFFSLKSSPPISIQKVEEGGEAETTELDKFLLGRPENDNNLLQFTPRTMRKQTMAPQIKEEQKPFAVALRPVKNRGFHRK